jgi:hypothetical protein
MAWYARRCTHRRITASHCSALNIPRGGDECKPGVNARPLQPPRYGAYLLRCWEVRSDRPGQPGTWRFSLEATGTGERRAFRDLEALVAHIEQELGRDDFGLASAQESQQA